MTRPVSACARSMSSLARTTDLIVTTNDRRAQAQEAGRPLDAKVRQVTCLQPRRGQPPHAYGTIGLTMPHSYRMVCL
jgi:hypothetical protein